MKTSSFFSVTSCTGESGVSHCAQGKAICPGDDFFGLPLLIFNPANNRLPQ